MKLNIAVFLYRFIHILEVLGLFTYLLLIYFFTTVFKSNTKEMSNLQLACVVYCIVFVHISAVLVCCR